MEPQTSTGLEYLVKAGKIAPTGQEASPARRTDSAPSVTETALEAFAASTVLKAVRDLAGDEGVPLSEVGEDLKMTGEILIPLARGMEDLGLIHTVKVTSFGDNTVAMDDEGIRVLNELEPVEALRRLGL
ncbi:MAG: hypothetical protein GY946_17805 [bacterium]|nr:hypothetical protein [bacterium]